MEKVQWELKDTYAMPPRSSLSQKKKTVVTTLKGASRQGRCQEENTAPPIDSCSPGVYYLTDINRGNSSSKYIHKALISTSNEKIKDYSSPSCTGFDKQQWFEDQGD